MRELILQELDKIEREENVKILFCAEAGSRVWGFSSPNSDYDVRFVYIRPVEDYLRLDAIRDVIEWRLDDMMDIVGWDLQKALRLLYHSNPTLSEWDRSPIVYRRTEEWDCISETIRRLFAQGAEACYYTGVAKKNHREYLSGMTVRLKKYFYALRPILACRWILKQNSPPPISIWDLMDACLDTSVRPDVEKLLYMKMKGSELGTDHRIDSINAYIERSIIELEKAVKRLPLSSEKPWDDLNKVFLQTLKKAQHERSVVYEM